MSNEIESAQMAGVEAGQDFAIFQNKGYQGLYGGLGVKEIHERKGLKKNEKILDHMGSTELAANPRQSSGSRETPIPAASWMSSRTVRRSRVYEKKSNHSGKRGGPLPRYSCI